MIIQLLWNVILIVNKVRVIWQMGKIMIRIKIKREKKKRNILYMSSHPND